MLCVESEDFSSFSDAQCNGADIQQGIGAAVACRLKYAAALARKCSLSWARKVALL